MGLISEIKANAQNTGKNKEKILYVKADSKVRVRFLQELDDGVKLKFHVHWEKGINALCGEELGIDCSLCDWDEDDEMREKIMYAWSVYNFDTKRVEIALYAANQCSPVMGFITMAEEHNGTIMDRDYVLKKNGKGTSSSYTVIPQDKVKFRNEKAKPFTKSALLKIIAKAFPVPNVDSDEDEEETKTKKKKKTIKKPQKEDYEDEDDFDEDYDEMKDDDDENYAMVDDEDVEDLGVKSEKSKKSSKKKNKDKDVDEEDMLEWMEEYLEDNDCDLDDFLEYCEVTSLKKLKCKNKKNFKSMVEEYIEYLED